MISASLMFGTHIRIPMYHPSPHLHALRQTDETYDVPILQTDHDIFAGKMLKKHATRKNYGQRHSPRPRQNDCLNEEGIFLTLPTSETTQNSDPVRQLIALRSSKSNPRATPSASLSCKNHVTSRTTITTCQNIPARS